MVGERPSVNPTTRYTTAETCKLLGINRTTLHRYWKKQEIVKHIHRITLKPYYMGSDIMKFWCAEMTVDKSCGGARGRRNSCA